MCFFPLVFRPKHQDGTAAQFRPMALKVGTLRLGSTRKKKHMESENPDPSLLSWLVNLPPPNVPPPRNKGLIRPY